MSKEHSRPHNQVQHHGPAWKRLHRDWRVWVGVVLMLAAMVAYVVSQDESIRPGGALPKSTATAPVR